MLDIIISQGRIGDRSAKTIEGAARAGEALAKQYGVQTLTVGDTSPPCNDDWRVSLPEASETLAALRRSVETSITAGRLPLLVANTCSASLASLPVSAKHHPEAVVLWVDAHGDFNTPDTTDTGYLGGMVLAAVCGLWDSGHGSGVRPSQVILVGARDIDLAERILLRNAGVRILSPAEANPERVLAEIGSADVWIHIDWDALEPGFVPADYEVPEGILPEQLRSIFAAIPQGRVRGVEIAEYHLPTDKQADEAAITTIQHILGPLFEEQV